MAPHPSLRDTLSPRGEGKVSISPSWESSQTNICNFFLAPWGEDAHRAGEGLFW